jgi:hypothetical protein
MLRFTFNPSIDPPSVNPSPNPGPDGPANVTLDPQTYSNFKLKGQFFPSGKFHKK